MRIIVLQLAPVYRRFMMWPSFHCATNAPTQILHRRADLFDHVLPLRGMWAGLLDSYLAHPVLNEARTICMGTTTRGFRPIRRYVPARALSFMIFTHEDRILGQFLRLARHWNEMRNLGNHDLEVHVCEMNSRVTNKRKKRQQQIFTR